VLFKDKSLQRSDIEVCRISVQQKLYRNALHLSTQDNKQPVDNIWGRRSIFTIQQKPLLVSEFFLPAIGYT